MRPIKDYITQDCKYLDDYRDESGTARMPYGGYYIIQPHMARGLFIVKKELWHVEQVGRFYSLAAAKEYIEQHNESTYENKCIDSVRRKPKGVRGI